MITRATEFGFCASSWIGSTVGTPVRRGFSGAGVVEALPFAISLFSGRNTLARGFDTAQGLADVSADFRRLEGVVTRRPVHLAALYHAHAHPMDKAAKRGDWMGACSLSRFP